MEDKLMKTSIRLLFNTLRAAKTFKRKRTHPVFFGPYGELIQGELRYYLIFDPSKVPHDFQEALYSSSALVKMLMRRIDQEEREGRSLILDLEMP